MNTLVSFQLAKLLKEREFDKRAEKRYGTKSGILYNDAVINDLEDDVFTAAPTIAEVVMWLYEKHEIWIWSTPQIDLKGEFYWKWYVIKLSNMRPKSATSIIKHPMFRDMNSTPEKAYEAAIEFILEKKII